MSDYTVTFLLGYLRMTQWASALREAKDKKLDLDPDRIRELLQEQKEYYNLDIEYIEQLVEDDEMFKWEIKQDKL